MKTEEKGRHGNIPNAPSALLHRHVFAACMPGAKFFLLKKILDTARNQCDDKGLFFVRGGTDGCERTKNLFICEHPREFPGKEKLSPPDLENGRFVHLRTRDFVSGPPRTDRAEGQIA